MYVCVYAYVLIYAYISTSTSTYLYLKQSEASVSKGLKPKYCVSLEITVICMVTCSRRAWQHKKLWN